MQVFLLLFDNPLDQLPTATIKLNPNHYKTGDIWHVWVEGVSAGQHYAYRVEGPYRPRYGHRFNQYKVLLDPYARTLSEGPAWDFEAARGFEIGSALQDVSFSTEDNIRSVPRCIVIDDQCDWQNDAPHRISWSDTIIYETHVRGLTIHPSSNVEHPGTFRGLIEKIPYFEELGITAVELLPIQEFNEKEIDRTNPITGKQLTNYWGYSTISFFAPKAGYSVNPVDSQQVAEFKEMVRELHRAGIEVILDIVFNHTAEGNECGPTLSFRGLDNTVYYILKRDKRFYHNYSGCGNTFNCNHPVVRQFIIDCLIYWVVEMHVDGFRFDLASIMGRDQDGEMMQNPPLLQEISENPILRDVKLIAEAWDAAGAYQVGSFQNHLWSDWNGRFRDDVRLFWRGDPGMVGNFASRICGSADLYQRSGKEPVNSINFITCHDGFTMNDLVSYNTKHNEANGEENRDGSDQNFSYNYGIEGPTKDSSIESIRKRQIKNMIATLFISRGVPLFLGGDEFRRTQHGNNNPFCQDNDVSWYDWSLLRKNADIFRFTKEMVRFRNRHKVVREVRFYTEKDIEWYGVDGGPPDWGYESRSVACMLFGGQDLYLMVHAGFEKCQFNVPESPKRDFGWHIAVDTALPSPDDIAFEGNERLPLCIGSYTLQPRSLVILVAKKIVRSK
jgi:glycogen operon protein